jgi:hypothetical protein
MSSSKPTPAQNQRCCSHTLLLLLCRAPCLHSSQQYVKGLITMSAPFGGTTDQAITVRMGAVEWNINEWVKNPLSKVAKDLASHAQVRATAVLQSHVTVCPCCLKQFFFC